LNKCWSLETSYILSMRKPHGFNMTRCFVGCTWCSIRMDIALSLGI